MEKLNKVVRLGTVQTGGGAWMSVYAKIEYDGKRLSITGVEGPTQSGNALGGCGQIDMHYDRETIRSMRPAPGWDHGKIIAFFQTWKRWHLNDMRAGSPAQRNLLDEVHGKYRSVPYQEAVATLEEHGLLVDPDYIHNGKPYQFGTGWLSETVPDEVLDFLASLPDTDKEPAWV